MIFPIFSHSRGRNTSSCGAWAKGLFLTNIVLLLPSYGKISDLTEREGESPLRVETYDESGALLGSFLLRLSEACAEGASGERPLAVRGFVPFHPRSRRVVFSYLVQPVQELVRSASAPRAEFTWVPSDTPAGEQVVAWAGDHPEGLPVEYFLRFSNNGGETWNRIGARTSGQEQVVDFDQLSGGERCLLALVATDGINTTVVESTPFALPRKPCIALIVHPATGRPIPPTNPSP